MAFLLALLIKFIFEIPFFAMSKKFMSRYSYPMLLTLVALIYTIRWMILGVSDDLYILVWSQILLSLSYSLQYFVSVAYVDFITPEKYRATGQTIYWAVTFGLGGLIGNVLAGVILNNVTIGGMYRLSAGVTLICITFLWMKPKKGENKSSAVEYIGNK